MLAAELVENLSIGMDSVNCNMAFLKTKLFTFTFDYASLPRSRLAPGDGLQ
jgi:hypothetical protein